jgi:hypothetical protein
MNILAKIVMASSILGGVPAQAVTEINFWLWDNNQRPSYEACAQAFEKQNPDPQGTLFLPITDHGNDVVRILRATFDSIFLDGADAEPKLQAANQEIDSLFQ